MPSRSAGHIVVVPANWFAGDSPEAFRCQFTFVRADGSKNASEPATSTDLVILYPIT
jgi:hypothetical protein